MMRRELRGEGLVGRVALATMARSIEGTRQILVFIRQPSPNGPFTGHHPMVDGMVQLMVHLWHRLLGRRSSRNRHAVSMSFIELCPGDGGAVVLVS